MPRSGVFRVLNDPRIIYPLVCDLATEGFLMRLACGVLGFQRRLSTPGAIIRSPSGTRRTPTPSVPCSTLTAMKQRLTTGFWFMSSSGPASGLENAVKGGCIHGRNCSPRTSRKDAKANDPAHRSTMPCCAGTSAAEQPNRKLVTDAAEPPTAEGNVYCARLRICSPTGSSCTRAATG